MTTRLRAAAQFFNAVGTPGYDPEVINGSASENDIFSSHYGIKKIYGAEWFAYPNLVNRYHSDVDIPMVNRRRGGDDLSLIHPRTRIESFAREGLIRDFIAWSGISDWTRSALEGLGAVIGFRSQEINDIRNVLYPRLMSDQMSALSPYPNVNWNQTAYDISTQTADRIAIGYTPGRGVRAEGGGYIRNRSYYNQIDAYDDRIEPGGWEEKIKGAFHPNRAG